MKKEEKVKEKRRGGRRLTPQIAILAAPDFRPFRPFRPIRKPMTMKGDDDDDDELPAAL